MRCAVQPRRALVAGGFGAVMWRRRFAVCETARSLPMDRLQPIVQDGCAFLDDACRGRVAGVHPELSVDARVRQRKATSKQERPLPEHVFYEIERTNASSSSPCVSGKSVRLGGVRLGGNPST